MIRRTIAACVMLAAAVFLTLLAHDAWRWGRAMHDADARAALGPVSANAWRAHPILPGRLAERLLGVDDDLAFRTVEERAYSMTSRVTSLEDLKQRSIVETALARIVHDESTPARASWAADALGVMSYADPPSPDQGANAYEDPSQADPTSQLTPDQKAAVQFTTAVRLNPDNDNAQRNLELMLRVPQQQPHKGDPQPGGGDRFGHKGSGARPPGNGY
ncbi:MAG: hypothetical protein H0X39_07935 [Actinobacteria bacterium]|nr:hypothetical protein [Actinomycetota bacterium]